MKKTLQTFTLIIVLAVTSNSMYAQSASVTRDQAYASQVVSQSTNQFKLGAGVIMPYTSVVIKNFSVRFSGSPEMVKALKNLQIQLNGSQQGSTCPNAISRCFVTFTKDADANVVQGVLLFGDIQQSTDSISKGSYVIAKLIVGYETYKGNGVYVYAQDSASLQKIYWKSQTPGTTDIKNFFVNEGIVAYPNPATNLVEFSNTPMDANVTITDLTGRAVYTGQGNRVDASLFQNGVYVAQIATGNTVSYVRFTKF